MLTLMEMLIKYLTMDLNMDIKIYKILLIIGVMVVGSVLANGAPKLEIDRKERDMAATEQKAKTLVASAKNALATAINKAVELKYDLEKHWVVLTQTETDGWEIYLKPRNKIQRGGGITVHIDNDGNISKVQRWR